MTRGPLERKTMKEEIDTQTRERLFVLSANDKVTTEKAMQKLGVYLEQRPEVFQNDLLSNLAYTLGQRKSLHPWRIAITAPSAVELVESLSNGRVIPAKQELEELRLGWIFTGQGAQWWAMGRELYEHYPVYASALDRADAHLLKIGASFSLLEELQKDETSTQVNAAHISQPACSAVQLALVELLRSWKISPTAVVGHSSGEIAAAYSAGIITFEDAMTIAFHRGRLIPILKERYPALDGCMMAVGAGATDILPLIERIPLSLGEARIACINSPSSVTVSGDAEAVAALQTLIEKAHPGMFARRLAVDTAYHSHHMNLVAKEYTESLRKLQTPQPSGIRFHSSLLGRTCTARDLDASYWVQNLTCAVRFDEAVQSMCAPSGDFKTGVNFLIELGPHSALQGPIKQVLKHVGGAASKIAYTSALVRKRDAVQSSLALAGTLFVKGSMLDLGAINFPKPLERSPQVLTDMPRYAWNHSTSYYHESRLTKIHKFHDAPRNDLIGVMAPYADDMEPTWRNVLRLDDVPWLRHHQMQGVTIFPISGFAVMAIEAMAQHARANGIQHDTLEVKDLNVLSPVMLTEEDLEMTTTLRKPTGHQQPESAFVFHIRTWSKTKGWSENCTGYVCARLTIRNEVDGERVQSWTRQKLHARSMSAKQAANNHILLPALYSGLSDIGVAYGATLQGLHECRASPSASCAQIAIGDTASEMPNHYETDYILHPTILEQLITMYWPVLKASGSFNTVHLPSSIGKVTVSLKGREHLQGPGSTLPAFCEASAPLSDYKSNTLSMVATTDAGEPLVSIEDLLISPILEQDMKADVEGARELCYKTDWEPAPLTVRNEDDVSNKDRFDASIVIIHGDAASQRDLARTLSDRLAALTRNVPATGSLTSLADVSNDKLCIVITELETPLLAGLSAQEFGALQRLLTSVRGVLWAVRGAYTDSTNPDANMIMGLSRTLRSEGTLMKFITLDLDADGDLNQAAQASTILDVFSASLSADSKLEETEFMERSGKLLTPRIVNDTTMNEYVNEQIHPSPTEPACFLDTDRPLRGTLQTPGVLDSLAFEDCDLPSLLDDEVEIQVKAISLNHADTDADSAIGLECSGIVTAAGSSVPNFRAGDRVAGFTPKGSLSTVTRAHHPFLFKLPDHMATESAATIPLAYCTASYALIDQARLCENESLLVHDAASAVGQAALAIAQTIGAEIWTTVNNTDEKALLMQEFAVPEDRILYGGDENFVASIKDATSGRGVDVVIDSLTNAHLHRATCDTLASFGRLIRVGAGTQAPVTASLDQNVTTYSIDIVPLAAARPKVFQRILANVACMLKYGKIHSIHGIKTYGILDVVTALQGVQAKGPQGKVLMVPKDEELVMVSCYLHCACIALTHQGPATEEASHAASGACDIRPYRWHGRPWS